MSAMNDDAVDQGALVAHLYPARPAMIAGLAAFIVEYQHAVADLEEVGIDVRPDFRDHPAGLMAANDRRVRIDAA